MNAGHPAAPAERPLPRLAGTAFYAAALATMRRRADAEPSTNALRFSAPAPDPRHVAAYRDQLGFAGGDDVPLTYWYLLAQRAQLGVMLQRGFPFPVLGMVHVANAMTREEAATLEGKWTVVAGVRECTTSASGARFVTLSSTVMQDARPVARCTSRYLARRGARAGGPPDAAHARPARVGELASRYALAGDAGRRYARLSGDANPIHLWPWSARLFGFRRPIIQGMHTVARVAAVAEARLGRPLGSIDATFLKPVALPAQVDVQFAEAHYHAWCGDALAVSGTIG